MSDQDEPNDKNAVVPIQETLPISKRDEVVSGSVEYLTNRLSIHQQTKLAKAEAVLGRALTELKSVAASWEEAALALNKQLAENEAYDFHQDVRMHKMKAELDEIELARALQEARHGMKLDKKKQKAELKDKPKQKSRKRSPQQPSFEDTAEDILSYGTAQKHARTAEQKIQDVLREADVTTEDELPEEMRDRIAELRREAVRLDQSKGK